MGQEHHYVYALPGTPAYYACGRTVQRLVLVQAVFLGWDTYRVPTGQLRAAMRVAGATFGASRALRDDEPVRPSCTVHIDSV